MNEQARNIVRFLTILDIRDQRICFQAGILNIITGERINADEFLATIYSEQGLYQLFTVQNSWSAATFKFKNVPGSNG